ncbi:MAG: hypothetical protein Q4F95_15195 [Oscillospiraceae bacterium]|nr:hypothetical protein [Oscillospiraceae bacterium]
MDESEVKEPPEVNTEPEEAKEIQEINSPDQSDDQNGDQSDDQNQKPDYEAMYNDSQKELTQLRKYVTLFEHNIDVTKGDYDKIIKTADKLCDENTDFTTAVEMVKKMYPGCEYHIPMFSYPVGKGSIEVQDHDGFRKALSAKIGG